MRFLRVVFVSLVGLVLVLAGISAAYTVIQTARIEQKFPPLGEFADVAGIRLHYVDLPANDPEAPVIVFIHGASGNLRDPLLAFRPKLIGQFRLIFIDRPGHGYSTRGPRDVSSPLAQAEVIHQFLGSIGIEHAVIVGHSWGAAVAAAYAVTYKSATSALMLLAPATNPWPGGVDWYYGVATTPVIGEIFARTIVLPIGQMQLPLAIQGVFAPAPVPPTYSAGAGISLVMRPSEFLANAEDVVNLKTNVIAMAPHYHEITAPTVIFAGAGDLVVRNDLHADVLAREIKGAHLTTLPDVGHMPQFSAPDIVIGALADLANGTRTHGYADAMPAASGAVRPM